jgi:hypothetical protein
LHRLLRNCPVRVRVADQPDLVEVASAYTLGGGGVILAPRVLRVIMIAYDPKVA